MFPWERRQLRGDGTGLQTWEKLYWGVFVTAISVFLFSRLAGPKKVAEEDPVRHCIDRTQRQTALCRCQMKASVLSLSSCLCCPGALVRLCRDRIASRLCDLGLASACTCCTQEEKAQREQKKSHMARLVLAGQSSFTSDESDVFEGLSPREIQVFVDEV